MITAISNTNYAKNYNSRQKSVKKEQSFGQMTYFLDGKTPILCSKTKESHILRKYAEALKSMIYLEGPKDYSKKAQNTHALVSSTEPTHARIEENYKGERGKHVLEIVPNDRAENPVFFIQKDRDNKGILNEIRMTLRQLREQQTFKPNDAKEPVVQ